MQIKIFSLSFFSCKKGRKHKMGVSRTVLIKTVVLKVEVDKTINYLGWCWAV